MLDEPRDIADLEAEIEALRDEADRSRKLTIVAKLVIVAGAVMLPVSFLVSSPTALVMGIAAFLGSIALFGSNERTLNELREQISTLESRRSELIDHLELQEVELWFSRSALEVRAGDRGGAAGAEASEDLGDPPRAVRSGAAPAVHSAAPVRERAVGSKADQQDWA
jgi:hypothetical protein